jgi:outer membrane receptor protein involved in Fe transport
MFGILPSTADHSATMPVARRVRARIRVPCAGLSSADQFRTTLAALALASCLLTPAAGRAGMGAVAGRVTDAAGRPVANAAVAIVTRPGAQRIGATTANDGSYVIARVPAGAWSIRATRLGYVAQTRPISVRAGERARLDFTLVAAAAELSRVQVTGTADAAAEIRQSPFAVTIIEGARLAGRGLTIDEALQRATGVQVRRSGGLGSASVFHVRGLEGQRVQVYVDGNAADVAGNAFSLDDIPLQLVERIEIYKGVVPARFGGDGLGAAINIVTLHPASGYTDVGYTAGSYGQHQLSATVQRPIPGTGTEALLTVNVDRAANDYTMASPFQRDLVIRRDHDRFRRVVVGGSLATGRLWFDEVELESAYFDTRREIQGIRTNVRHAAVRNRFGSVVLQAERDRALRGQLDLRLGLVAANARGGLTDTASVRHDFDGTRYPSPNGRGELGYVPYDSDNRTRFYRHRAALTYRFAPEREQVPVHTANITYVLDLTRFRPSDSLANRYAGRNVSDFPGDQASAVMGLSHEWRPLGERFVTVAGVRGYWMRSSGTPSNLLNPSTETSRRVESRTLAAGASEAVRYRFTPALLGKASVELARRLPSNTELFGDGQLVVASPVLRPEESRNLSAGLQLDRALGAGRLQAEANAFVLHLRDMIRLGQSVFGAAYTNLGAARIAGFDAEVRSDLTPWLHAQAGLTYQDARDVLRHEPGTAAPNPTRGLRVPNLPWLFGTALVEAHAMDLFGRRQQSRLFYEGSLTEEYFYAFEVSRRQERRIPRALTHTLGVEQRWLGRGLTLSAEVQNLFDARVLNQFNHPLPGRTIRVKLRHSWIGSGHRHDPTPLRRSPLR